MDSIGSIVTKNRKPIEMLLVALILVHFAPTEVLGSQLDAQIKSVLGPVLNPLNAIMDYAIVRLFLWLALLWACCTSKDMNLFFLVVVYFVVSGK
tara:strand:+ start:4009 stop:4293 length:285 start_codon:yes stop_codon:yes gene_type:complete